MTNPRSRRQLPLIIGLLVVIGVVTATIFQPQGRPRPYAQWIKSRACASALARAIDDLCARHPDLVAVDLTTLTPSLLAENLIGEDMLIDPWNNPFLLVRDPRRPERAYILSFGRDNLPGGEGHDADFVVDAESRSIRKP